MPTNTTPMNLTSRLLPQDLAAVSLLIDTYLYAWNERNTAAFVEHFTEYAEFTDSMGQVAIGKPAIERLIDFQFSVTGDSSRIDFNELYLRYLQQDLVIGTGKWIFDMPGKPECVGAVHIICSKRDSESWKILFMHSIDGSYPHLK